MYDQGTKSVNNANETSGQTTKSYQSSWMSHWIRTATVAAGETRNHNAFPEEELNCITEDDVSNKIILISMGNERVEAVRPVVEDNLEKGKVVASKDGIQFHSLGEGTSKKPPKWMKKQSTPKDRIFEMPNPSQEKNAESLSRTVPYSFDLGKKTHNFCKDKIVESSSNTVPYSSSGDLVCERKLVNACFSEGITCDRHLSESGRDWFPKMPKCSGVRLFPSQRIALDEFDGAKKSEIDCRSQLKLQDCVRDGSEGKLEPGWCSRFSRTTHTLLITKKTDVNQLKQKDVFESRVITKTSGNKSNDRPRMWPFLRRSPDSKTMENVRAFKASMSNSSAETDIMDFDSLKKKNLHSGSHSTASAKAFNMESNLSPSTGVISSSRESGPFIVELPDINLEPPSRSSDNTFPISSKTQSLDTEMLVAHVEQPNTKPNCRPDDCPIEDNRWVKRLKMTRPNPSPQGKNSSNSAKNSSHVKTNKSFSRLLKNSATEELGKVSSEDYCFEKDKGIIGGSENKGMGILLSDAWIRRWLSSDSSRFVAEKKLPYQTVVVNCKARNLKLISIDDSLEKMQFPSIAAMALMGKALTCFQPCELQKRGSFTIWKTKAVF